MAFALFKTKEKPKRSKLHVVRPKPSNRKSIRPKSKPISTQVRDVDTSDFLNLTSIFNNSKAGVVVTPKTALQFSTVFACVDLIASTISIIPLNIFEDTGSGKYPAKEHDQYYLLRKQPHKMYSRLQWDKLMIVHYLLWGDGISIIKRNDFGRPVSYELVMPWDVDSIDKVRNKETGENEIWYKIDGKMYNSDDVIHYSDLSIDGIKGCGRISQNKESIGLGLGLRDYGNELLASGGKTMGYIYGERGVSKGAYRLLTESFLNGYGSDNGVGVLPKGFKYEPFTHPMPPASAEYIASKNFSKEEICTIFRTPPLLIGSTTGINNSVAESIMRTWLMSTIAPITTMMELELDRKVFRESEKNTHYIKYNLWALDKADIEKTMNALVQGVNNGIYNKDEARSILDRNPIPDGLGEDFYQALNQAPLQDAKEYFKKENIKDE